MKFLVMQFSEVSYYFILFESNIRRNEIAKYKKSAGGDINHSPVPSVPKPEL
jgi:hypothetical protein